MSAGPITLFDKSFIQQLSVDESVWFDHFFITNICPIFYIETLADLEKIPDKESWTSEREVMKIANKFPEVNGTPNMFHATLGLMELLGNQIPMTGQIIFSSGKRVEVNSQYSDVSNQSEEMEAFLRWQNEEFLELERHLAKKWRTTLNKINFDQVNKILFQLKVNGTNCHTLIEAKIRAEYIIESANNHDLLHCVLILLNIPNCYFEAIFQHWKNMGYQPLKRYAPYITHILTVEIFFYIALDAQLLGVKSSNRQDISYLFYLPFCMQFVSNDKLHRQCAPLFLRKNQQFVWGQTLKNGLVQLNMKYKNLPNDIIKMGISHFAKHPPIEEKNYVSDLWDIHFQNWRKKWITKSANTEAPPNPSEEKIQSVLKKTNEALISPPMTTSQVDIRDVRSAIYVRKIKRKKGNWFRLLSRKIQIQLKQSMEYT